MKQTKIDTQWFLDLIHHSPYGSERALAARLRTPAGKRMDQSTLWRSLRGQRKIAISEAKQIADLLEVPLLEVLAHAGLSTLKLEGAGLERRFERAVKALRECADPRAARPAWMIAEEALAELGLKRR